ncbi:MAG TPA: hypothetical protein DCR97_07505, partial [Deltaproteobacteria bacterium]|nr:hypothetical protein [Deltaproteobacteria bacterium]
MPKIGGALKRAVEIRSPEVTRGQARSRPSSVLMNDNRRKIYRYICLHPCSRIDAIALKSGMSRSSVSWHLVMLIKAGYAETFRLEGTNVYSPSGLVPRRNVQAFAVLARRHRLEIYFAVTEHTGSEAGELNTLMPIGQNIVKTSLRDLGIAGLITKVMDGRHVRYFPSGGYEEILSALRQTSKDFIRTLLKRMAEEHLEPEIINLKGVNLEIELRFLGR